MHHNLIIKDGDTTKVVKEVLVDGIQFVDEKPRAGSTNPVTSDGVNKAIGDTKESVDEDVHDLQERIDEIAEKAGSGYIPKGDADVSTINALTGQENGWLYTLTDDGTLTDGSIAVVAGDTVAWDDANSVWYKAMNYAPAQYGMDQVKNLPTTITAFRTGDVIPVDGPSGTAKMSKDSLLQITANYSVDEGIAAAAATTGTITDLNLAVTAGYIDRRDGSVITSMGNSHCTGFVDLGDYANATFYIDSIGGWNSCIFAIYDEDEEFIAAYGTNNSGYVRWDGEKVVVSEILADHPNAKYARFSAWPENREDFGELFVGTWVLDTIDSINANLTEKISQNTQDISELRNVALPTTGTITDLNLAVTAGYIDRRDGSVITSMENSHCTGFVDLGDYANATFYIDSIGGWNSCIFAIYDEDEEFIAAYGTNNSGYVRWDGEKVVVSEILADHPNAKYARFSAWPENREDFGELFVGTWVLDTIDVLVQKLKAGNTLYGKKWVACGDSYTQATNLGTAGFDPVMGIYKSYAWWIAQRSGCNLVMMAKSGERIHNDPNSTNKFTPDRYKTIPTDADIITLSFGLNEIWAEIGDSSSTDNTTLWGAFNEVLGWIMNNIPKAKVGIIIADGWMPTRIADAERAIAEYWCIPCLDLKYDPNVPLGISGNAGGVPQVRPNTSALAQSARNGVFADQSTHPNADAHEYRSTFIEAWMKTL